MKQLSLLMIILGVNFIYAEEDPFGGDQSKAGEVKGILTLSENLVTPIPEFRPELIHRSNFPHIEPPTAFHRSFEVPSRVWRIAGGFFASFDAGEFGGALFHAAEGAKQWTKVVDGHFQDLGMFKEGAFLAVGGLAHLTLSRGEVCLISQQRDGSWRPQTIMKSGWGVPKLIGQSYTDIFSEAKSFKMLVVSITDPMNETVQSLIGFDVNGKTYFLGPKSK